ncbi:MAG: hydrogenase formation protein HypD [Coriobacteriia bacterium]|nr:hydrogenase formation protein HypD [Coriobacteriia bacterium]
MDLTGFRDPVIARGLIEAINSVETGPVKFMEVCGTHTVAIAKHGLRAVMPDSITLLSGPGCPVCVTGNRDIDIAVEYARQPGVIVTTFGDMMKVPGSYSSLSAEKAEGHDVRIVYSPLDALDLAERNPDRLVVFIGVGFETTVPIIASAIEQAARRGLDNFTVFSAHKTVPDALRALVNDPDVAVGGFILPGHVSVIIGVEPYRFLAEEFGVPSVITGFEPVDVLQGVLMLANQVADGRAEVEVAYTRAVPPSGNPAAIAAMERVFEPVDAEWRGIGVIPGTGLAIREQYAAFDAMKRLPVEPPEQRDIKGCQCGEVLRGITLPFECRLFAKACTPEHPVGPCMVSSEGSCAAYHRYTDYGRTAPEAD